MSNSDTSDINDEATTEVELSADDLLELSSPAIQQSARVSETKTLAEPADVVPITQPVRTVTASRPSMRQLASSRKIFLPLGGLAAAVIAAIGLQYRHTPSAGLPQSSLASEPRAVTPVAEDESIATEQPPVQFTNPFDPSEVFEFPAGTSHAEARDAVADLLLKRATERRELHARS